MMDVKFSVFEMEIDYDKKKEIKETNELKGIELNPLSINRDLSLLDNIYYNRFFTLPEIPDMTYREVMLQCVSKLYFQLVDGLSKSHRLTEEDDFTRFNTGEGRNEEGIHLELRHFLARLGAIVQYTINSSSYRDGEFYEFDAMTLINNLDTLQYYCSHRLYKEDLGVVKKEPSFEAISTDILKRRVEPFYTGEKLGASIDDILEKIEKEEIEHHNRFFYIKHDGKFYFYTFSDLK